MKSFRFLTSCLLVATLVLPALPASATPVNLILNGDFNTVLPNTNVQLGETGSAQHWTPVRNGGSPYSGASSLAIVGDTDGLKTGGTGANVNPLFNNSGSNVFTLWGTPVSPSGGNMLVVCSDRSWVDTTVSQTVSGLVVGQTYKLAFDWAGAQQSGFSGDTQTRVLGEIGGFSFFTPYQNVLSESMGSWSGFEFLFTAASSTAVLDLNPDANAGAALNPFALIDNVSLTEVSAVPEIDPVGVGSVMGLLAGAFCLLERRRLRIA